jgi:molecular chaperone GrpE
MNKLDPDLTSRLLAAMSRQPAQAEADEARQIMLSFLDVLDAVDRLAAVAADAEMDSAPMGTRWLDHMGALQQQMVDTFLRSGVKFFDCNGQLFNPEQHEIVKVEQRDDVNDYTIMTELSRGCEWQGQVLRVARVVVARHTQDKTT